MRTIVITAALCLFFALAAFGSQGTLPEALLLQGADVVAVIDIKTVEDSSLSLNLARTADGISVGMTVDLQVYRGQATVVSAVKGCIDGDKLIVMSVAQNGSAESDQPSLLVGRHLAFLKKNSSSVHVPTSWMSIREIGNDGLINWPIHSGGGWAYQDLLSVLRRLEILQSNPKNK